LGSIPLGRLIHDQGSTKGSRLVASAGSRAKVFSALEALPNTPYALRWRVLAINGCHRTLNKVPALLGTGSLCFGQFVFFLAPRFEGGYAYFAFVRALLLGASHSFVSILSKGFHCLRSKYVSNQGVSS
jgi:hypothetical protein